MIQKYNRMKLLTLIRHAKSDMNYEISDFERVLNKQGEADAKKIGSFIVKEISKPDLIIASPAFRTAKTAEIIANKYKYSKEKIEFVNELYMANISDYIDVIASQNVEINHILIVSHNPGTTGFTNVLTDNYIGSIPPCGVAHVELDVDNWKNIEMGKGKLIKYFSPEII